MKKLIVIIIYFFLNIFVTQGQKRNDFIITIDNQIISHISNAQVIVKNDSENKVFPVQYYPGNMLLGDIDYDLLPNEENTILLKFDYIYYSLKGEQISKVYEVNMGKNWFSESYIIIKIYNTDNKKFKKRIPLKGKNYDYDLEYAGGQSIRIRNK